MNPKTQPISRPSKRQHVAHISDVLIQMQLSGSIYFVKSLTKKALQTSNGRQTAKLSLPTKFVQENAEKIEERVTLRAHSPSGRYSRPWFVQLNVTVGPLEAAKVQMVGGWPAFVAGNRLREGDYLVFLLKEDARSEFEVYMFQGPWGFPYYPNEGERSDPEEETAVSDSEEEEKSNNLPRLPSPVHQQEEPKQDFARDIREGNPAPTQHTGNPRAHPGFYRRLTAYNIGRSSGERNSGQFELPRGFMRTYGRRVHDLVALQGIHENSRNYVVTCKRRPRDLLKAYFSPGEWSRFVDDNGLKEGDQLQFSLTAKSSFVVRKIS